MTIESFSRFFQQSAARQSYFVAIIFLACMFSYNAFIVWQAETQRKIPQKGIPMSDLFEDTNRSEFARLKTNAWEGLTLYSTLTVISLIFRNEVFKHLPD